MGKSTPWDWIRELVGSVGHHLFFWSLPMSEHEYRREIYLEERRIYDLNLDEVMKENERLAAEGLQTYQWNNELVKPGQQMNGAPMLYPRRLNTILSLCFVFVGAACAQSLPDIGTLRNAVKDKPVRNLAIGQAIAEIADGVKTRINVNEGQVESEPVAKALLGLRPTFARMIPIGIAENIGSMLLAEKMHRSSNRFIRDMFWLPQVFFIGAHGAGFVLNVRR